MDREQLQFSAEQTVQMTEKLIDALVNIRDENGAFLMTLADGRVVDTKGWGGWEWTHGIGLYGLWQYWLQTRNPRWMAIIEQWFTDRFREGTPTKNVNTMAPMLTLAALYEETGHSPWRRYIDIWANWVMHDMPRTELGGLQHMTFNFAHHQQLWDDTLMMSVMPLAKAGWCSIVHSGWTRLSVSSCCIRSTCAMRRPGCGITAGTLRAPSLC